MRFKMNDFDKANMIFKRYYPNEGKQNKKNSHAGIPYANEIMSARASALQKILQNNSFSDIEKDEILWAINYYNNKARNTKNGE